MRADQFHILFELARTVSVSQAVEEVKKSSSRWIKTQGQGFASFGWQAGYGAFAVSESNVPTVRDYIARQQEHHQCRSFREEYRTFLERRSPAFDEQYVWDWAAPSGLVVFMRPGTQGVALGWHNALVGALGRAPQSREIKDWSQKRREPGRRAWLSQKEEKKTTLVTHKDTPIRYLPLYADPASA